MNDAVIQCTYHDLKFVRTRGVVQIIFEAPLEHAQSVIEVLGTPNPGEERWCAVARLNGPGKQSEKPVKEPDTEGQRVFKHFNATVQDEAFMLWFWDMLPGSEREALLRMNGTDRAAVKNRIGIDSAKELLTDPAARERWDQLWTSFKYRDNTQ